MSEERTQTTDPGRTIGRVLIAGAILGAALGLGVAAAEAALDPARCAAKQPRIERRLQKGRQACLERTRRLERAGNDGDYESCERRQIARYGRRLVAAGCEPGDAEIADLPPPPTGPIHRARVRLRGEIADVAYEVIEDVAVYQGDIVLGSPEEVEAMDEVLRGGVESIQSHTRGDFGWSRNVIPFEISSGLSTTMRTRITSAVNHWNANTIVRLQARSGEADFVRFVASSTSGLCLSAVGRQGGRQDIRLNSSCSTGNIIHEIGHAVGLFHEQNRSDRDDFIVVDFDNMNDDDLTRAQFEKGPFGSVDHGTIDFGSIMMYGSFAFSNNGLATMTRLDGTTTWNAQRTALSTGDIVGVTRMVTGLDGLFTPKDKFRNQGANRCLDAGTGGSGRVTEVRTCTGTSRQRWLLYRHPRTNRRLLVNQRSGMCLDVPGSSRTSGVDLQQFPCHGGRNQAFTLSRPNFWDPWTIRNLNSNLCLSLESTANGGDVEQRTCSNTSTRQKWFQELF